MKRILTPPILCLLLAFMPAFARHEGASPTPGFYTHHLTLNGQLFDYANFNLLSFGTLTMLQGDPMSKNAKPVPFRIYLRRAGVVQTDGLTHYDREYLNITVQTILAKAKLGDELIIEPAHKSDGSERRIIPLKMFSWLRIVGDGC